MADELDPEHLKKLKRDAQIRAKEDEFERKRKEEEERKRQQLEDLRVQYEQDLERRALERQNYLKRQAEIRAQRKAENEKLNRRREAKIKKRHEDWNKRATAEVHKTLADADAEEERIEQARQDAIARKHAAEEQAADEKRAAREENEQLEFKRNEANEKRALQRMLKSISLVDQLKTEAQEELQSFIQNPFPVPLRQVLAGRSRPVPRVTELLAAYKDQREDLDDLIAQDIPMRATLRNMPLFTYVRDIQAQAEKEAIRPPNPVLSDLGRGGRNSPKATRQASSLSPSGRKGLSMQKSLTKSFRK